MTITNRAQWFGLIACGLMLAGIAVMLATHGASGHELTFLVAEGAAITAADLKELTKSLAEARDEVKKTAETTNAELKNLGKVTDETKQKADEAMVKHNEISARLTEIEQKMVQRSAEPEQRKSVGQMVVENDEVKAWIKSGGKGRVSVAVKAIISALTTDANGSAGDLIVPQRQPEIITPGLRTMSMRDLITPGN